MRCQTAALVLFTAAGCSCAGAADEEFYAYYTKVRSGAEFERFSRTGDHADIVVHLGRCGGRCVFWRGSSYLPYWETSAGRWYLPEVIPRSGDGTAGMPDRANTYARVFIIESNPHRVLILWRYCPHFGGTNPHTGVSATNFVEELFEFSPDGAVARTIRPGTPKFDAWEDPLNRSAQQLRLRPSGIVAGPVAGPGKSTPHQRRRGNPIQRAEVGQPREHWRFDEGAGDLTMASISALSCPVAGPKSFWKAGVSGTALQFDGYNTVVRLAAARAPVISGGLTLEGWIAIGAYPWNWAPMVQQGDDSGYFLGIDGKGHPGFKVQQGSRWEELVSKVHLERSRWYHLAGTFDAAQGSMALFVDGVECSRRAVGHDEVRTTGDDVQIGQGCARRPIDPVRRNTFSDLYSFDGLIDEVKIYDRALNPAEVRRSYELLAPAPDLRDHPDMDARVLPGAGTTGRFCARYTHLKFYESYDALWRFGDYPDVVVEFDELPAKFVFWRGTGYIPMLVNEKNQWYSNEFNETWGTSGGRGCQEPMSDKDNYTNHARILESSPARVVVQWRYPLIDVRRVIANYDEKTGWGDWSDWYYTIYPDGVAVKRMRLWTNGKRNHEWQESMAIFGPGQHPEQIIEKHKTLTMIDLAGHYAEYDWSTGPPANVRAPEKKCIQLINYTGAYDPFTIGRFQGSNVYGGELTPYAVFPTWNHWPIAQMPSDGRYASFPDRTAHSSLTHLKLPVHAQAFGERPFEERLLMEGMTDQNRDQLVLLARSWLQPAPLLVRSGATSGGYDRTQRAYLLAATAPRLAVSIKASRLRPLVNPCFVVRNWGRGERARLSAGGKALPPGPGARQGIVRDSRGRRVLIVWLRMRATRPVSLAIDGAAPAQISPLKGAPLRWLVAPRPRKGDPLRATMQIAPAGEGRALEYKFECTSDPALSSGWQADTTYSPAGLRPDSEYAFRALARDGYLFSESAWSSPRAFTTPAAPGPAAHWPLDEGSGRRVGDEAGRHGGTLEGAVWVSDRRRSALRFDGHSAVIIPDARDLPSTSSFTWVAWIRTSADGTILARAPQGERWVPGGKALFVRDGRLNFDVGWVGVVRSTLRITDGRWHQVAVAVAFSAGNETIRFYVDGRPAGGGTSLNIPAEPSDANLPVKIGYCNEDFPSKSGFTGDIAAVRWYAYALNAAALAKLMD